MTPEQEGMNYVAGLIALGVFSIDDEGRIWRHKKMSIGRKYWVWLDHPRRAEGDGLRGGLRLVVTDGSRTYHLQAHRLIWAHHNGPIPDGHRIRHEDGNGKNNRPDNLVLVQAGSPSHRHKVNA